MAARVHFGVARHRQRSDDRAGEQRVQVWSRLARLVAGEGAPCGDEAHWHPLPSRQLRPLLEGAVEHCVADVEELLVGGGDGRTARRRRGREQSRVTDDHDPRLGGPRMDLEEEAYELVAVAQGGEVALAGARRGRGRLFGLDPLHLSQKL